MSLVTVEVFLKFELYLQLNLDLHLDSTKLGLGLGIVLGLDLARGQTGGAPIPLTAMPSLSRDKWPTLPTPPPPAPCTKWTGPCVQWSGRPILGW